MLVQAETFVLVTLGLSTLVHSGNNDPVANTSTLKSVQIVFRHGKKVQDASLGNRTGLLNDEGKLEIFRVGTYARYRYGDFIDQHYDPNQVRITTSGAQRCIQSGTLFAYGIYQNFNQAAKWNTDDPNAFEPIPVNPIPPMIDRWLQLSAPCPKKKWLDDSFLAEAAMKSLEQHRDFYKMYSYETGELDRFENVTLQNVVEKTFPAVTIFDPSVPNPPGGWYKPLLNGTNLYYEFKFDYIDLFYSSPELRQLAAGPFFQMLYNRMELNKNPAKMYAYATHDFSITALTVLFGKNLRGFAPDQPTGTTYFLEVHETPFDFTAEPYLEIYYRNSSNVPIQQFEIQNCGSPCNVSKFKTLVQQWVPEDYEKMCSATKSSYSAGSITVLAVIASGLIAVTGILASVTFKRWKKRSEYVPT